MTPRTIKLKPTYATYIMKALYDDALRFQRMCMIDDALHYAIQLRRLRRALDLAAAYGSPVIMHAGHIFREAENLNVFIEIKGE